MIHAYAAYAAGGELAPFAYDPGELQAHEVEIDVLYCGICHSDLSVIDNEWGNSRFPVVPGHEVIGTIAQIGARVTGLVPGQSVGLGWHSGYCHVCDQCRSGHENLCPEKQSTIIGHHGGFADKVRADARSVVALPAGLELESAGPLFCAGITVFNPLVQFGIRPTDRVAVIGIGGLGHLALKFLRAWGCEVTAFTSSPAKAAEAMRLGAHHVLDSRAASAITSAAGRFDMILSTVNVKLDWNQYLAALRPGGRLHFVGATLEPLDINVFSLISGQRTVSGSPVGSPGTMADMLEFALRHGIRPEVEMFDFNQVNQALARLRAGKARYRIVLAAK